MVEIQPFMTVSQSLLTENQKVSYWLKLLKILIDSDLENFHSQSSCRAKKQASRKKSFPMTLRFEIILLIVSYETKKNYILWKALKTYEK